MGTATIANVPTRVIAVAVAVCALAAGLGIRLAGNAGVDGSRVLAQRSGTALYASMVYAGVVFLWPRMSPLRAGGIAVGFCWLVEAFQLTGIPAELSARSVVARLALGAQFDAADLAWYPIGIVPLVALHQLLRARFREEP